VTNARHASRPLPRCRHQPRRGARGGRSSGLLGRQRVLYKETFVTIDAVPTYLPRTALLPPPACHLQLHAHLPLHTLYLLHRYLHCSARTPLFLRTLPPAQRRTHTHATAAATAACTTATLRPNRGDAPADLRTLFLQAGACARWEPAWRQEGAGLVGGPVSL